MSTSTKEAITREQVIRALQSSGFIGQGSNKLWDPDDVILDIKLDHEKSCVEVWYETREGQKYHVISFAGRVKLIQQTPIK
jgi:hypothetical protein